MITAFVSADRRIALAVIAELSLEKREESTVQRKVYQKKGFVFVLLESALTAEDIAWVQENFMPDSLVFPFIGFSVSSQHEVGDIVFPNTFLSYNPLIQMKHFTKEDHNTLLGEAGFLDTFPLQRDYQVEDFGLSVGGIAVGNVVLQDTENFMSALDFTYEGDIYTTENLMEIFQYTKNIETGVYIL
jgi:hypothetical protein